MKVSEGLAQARALLEAGWTQKEYASPNGERYCSRGAIGMAFEDNPFAHRTTPGAPRHTAEQLLLQEATP